MLLHQRYTYLLICTSKNVPNALIRAFSPKNTETVTKVLRQSRLK